MSSHHNQIPNAPHSPNKNKSSINEIDREIKMGELRLRYVKLMRDFQTSLGEEDATDLIKESMDIWRRLNLQKKI